MGGIGKTQLARAYAHRYRDEYRLGWWTPAETPLTTTTALAELAVRLGAAVGLSQSQQLTYAREALAERDRWLLVFDNTTDPAALEPFLPAFGNGHVLITSRCSAWHGLADPTPVDLLPLDAAAELLRERSGDPDQQAAETLAEELGQLPLALEQAAAYASRQQLSLTGYLQVFRARRAELLARGQPLAYHLRVRGGGLRGCGDLEGRLLLSVAAVAYAVATGLTLYASGHVERRISPQAGTILDRIAGILLTSIAVILLASGFTDLVVAALSRN
jgi:hypothetical protein